MEGITRLVDDSMARHGVDVPVDHRRLQWSSWLRCDGSFSLLVLPSAPGIYALAEEIVAPGDIPGGRRMLAVFEFTEAEDMCVALSRCFRQRSVLSERMSSGRCFLRFTRIGDPVTRHAACKALKQWLATSMEAATGRGQDFTQLEPAWSQTATSAKSAPADFNLTPPPLPAGF